MAGNLKAGTVVPDKSLFLSDNQFWYSVGKTKMKAFRAYFTFADVLAEVSKTGTCVLMRLQRQRWPSGNSC